MGAKAPAAQPPSESAVRALMGARYPLLEAFLARNAELRPEWKYYGERSGWTLKLFEKQRNLCFLSPQPDHLRVSFLLGQKAVAAALAAPLPAAVHASIRTARTYVEGTPVTVEVRSRRALVVVQRLLEIKRGS